MDSESDEPPVTDAAQQRLHGGPAQPVHLRSAKRTMRKVPELTVYFWITKVLTTAMGEATSDYLVHRFSPVNAVALGGVALAVSLLAQFAVRKYIAWIYWLAVVMVAIFGTMTADTLHIRFHVPYDISTPFFAVVLAVVFVTWHATEKTLSIHSIYTVRREAFYWATVIATFALGTAAGDMTATTMHLGYFLSGVLFACLIAVPALAYRFLGLNKIFAFWFAYIVTRPIGASFADWMSKPHSVGGLGWGDGRVSGGLTILIVGFVGYLSITRKDVKDGGVASLSE
jgi:uncharacterized membrane-anchored protein